MAVAAMLALAAVTAFGVAPPSSADLPPERTLRDSVRLDVSPPIAFSRFIQSERVRRGDTLAALLGRLGAIDPEFQRFVASDRTARKVLALRPGRTVLAEIDESGRVMRFSYRLRGLEEGEVERPGRPVRAVVIQRLGDDARLEAREQDVVVEHGTAIRSAEIRSTLFAAADAAGIPDGVASQIADIFGGGAEFTRSLHRGDRLRVVYETLREAGSFDEPAAGRILAIEIVGADKTRSAVRFERQVGRGVRAEYFDFEGHSLKHTFLRDPLEYSRVSSGFTESRLHPIMRDWRAHRGIDFAAPKGTKVRTVADGTVEFIGQQRGYGNVVFIRHDDRHSTVYAHLNGFVDGLHEGSSVNQGDVIGFVGQTGWATGPHLHYEFRVDGEPTDPTNVAAADASPLDAEDRARFRELAAGFEDELARAEAVRTASFE